MNPPHGKTIGHWMVKALDASRKGATVVCLYAFTYRHLRWHDSVESKAEVRFIKGRLKFVGAEHVAPFPSVIIIYKPTVAAPAMCA